MPDTPCSQFLSSKISTTLPLPMSLFSFPMIFQPCFFSSCTIYNYSSLLLSQALCECFLKNMCNVSSLLSKHLKATFFFQVFGTASSSLFLSLTNLSYALLRQMDILPLFICAPISLYCLYCVYCKHSEAGSSQE